MTTMPEDLRTFLVNDTTGVNATVSGRIHYNKLAASSTRPHIWFRTNSDTQERTLDQAGGLHESGVDLECIAATESAAQSLADKVLTRIDGYQGSMGNIRAQGIFVDSKDDDYEPRGVGADTGAHVVALDVRLWYTT